MTVLFNSSFIHCIKFVVKFILLYLHAESGTIWWSLNFNRNFKIQLLKLFDLGSYSSFK